MLKSYWWKWAGGYVVGGWPMWLSCQPKVQILFFLFWGTFIRLWGLLGPGRGPGLDNSHRPDHAMISLQGTSKKRTFLLTRKITIKDNDHSLEWHTQQRVSHSCRWVSCIHTLVLGILEHDADIHKMALHTHTRVLDIRKSHGDNSSLASSSSLQFELKWVNWSLIMKPQLKVLPMRRALRMPIAIPGAMVAIMGTVVVVMGAGSVVTPVVPVTTPPVTAPEMEMKKHF